jgi:hypothetical protein
MRHDPLERDCLKVPPFDCHPDGDGALRAQGLSAPGWRRWVDRRIPDRARLTHEVAAWEARRNRDETTMHWRFTTADARIKLAHLYPIVQVPPDAQAHSHKADQLPAA